MFRFRNSKPWGRAFRDREGAIGIPLTEELAATTCSLELDRQRVSEAAVRISKELDIGPTRRWQIWMFRI